MQADVSNFSDHTKKSEAFWPRSSYVDVSIGDKELHLPFIIPSVVALYHNVLARIVRVYGCFA